MLTKNDLQAIKEVIDERLDSKLEEKLEKKLIPIRKNITYIRKSVDVLVDSSDRWTTDLEKRVKKIEDHLKFLAQQN